MGQTSSLNRFLDPAIATATISAITTGTGFTAVAFLDKGLADSVMFTSSELAAGVSRKLPSHGLRILEVIVAFTSTKSTTCTIDVELVGSDKAKQKKSVPVSGNRDDVARVSFHAPII